MLIVRMYSVIVSFSVVPLAIPAFAFSSLVEILFLWQKPIEMWFRSAPESMRALANTSAILASVIIRLLGAGFKGYMSGDSRCESGIKVFLGNLMVRCSYFWYRMCASVPLGF